MADLFDLTAFAALLQSDLDTATAMQCRSMATGVVLGYCRLLSVPEDAAVVALMAPVALRVAAAFYENPSNLSAESFAGYSANYNSLLGSSDRLVLDFVAAQVSGRGRAVSVQLAY